MTYLFSLYQSPSSFLCTVFDAISSSKDKALSINPSANILVFRDFKVLHKNWLICSGGTDKPGKLCYNISIFNNRTQMVNVLTLIPECESHIPVFLDVFISSNPSICFTVALIPLANLIMLLIQFLLTFLQIEKGILLFIAQLIIILVLIRKVFMAIWDLFRVRASLKSIILLLMLNIVSGSRLELNYKCFLNCFFLKQLHFLIQFRVTYGCINFQPEIA